MEEGEILKKKDMNMQTKNRGFLYQVERIGNKLPHPFYIFLILCFILIVVSYFTEGIKIVHPSSGKTIAMKNLATADGFRWMLDSMTKNFINFRPLGMVLVMMLGLGLAEEVGVVNATLRKVVCGAPSSLVTAAVVFAGVMGNIASSASFVVIPPLGGVVFAAMGRNPIAGIAAGFAGVAAGLSANLLIVGTDVLTASITEDAARIISPNIIVHPAVNWYFMCVSVFVLVAVGTLICEKVVEPRLGKYDFINAEEDVVNETTNMELSDIEKKGLRRSAIAALIYIVVIAMLVIPSNGVLRDPKLHTIVPSPFLKSMVPLLLGLFVTAAIPYGITVKTIRGSVDVVKHMATSMKGFASFIVLCFAAGQFVAYFKWTNLSILMAVKGGAFLQATHFTGLPLLICFVLVVSFINFFIGSSSAKWAILAPIFVPMFMQVGFSPALTQVAYRIADSVTNSISPLEPFLPFIIAAMQRYSKDTGIGTVIATMLPFAGAFLVTWTVLLVVWYLTGLPLGPGAGLFM